MADIEAKVKAAVVKLVNVPLNRISSTADIRKLGIDSLMALELVAVIERTFRIHVPESRIRNIIRIDQIVKLVNGLKAGGEAKPRRKTWPRTKPLLLASQR